MLEVVKLRRGVMELVCSSALLVSCSSAPASKSKAVEAPIAETSTFTGTNPLGKDIELSGYRISDADMGAVTLRVGLTTTAAKPGDAPIAEFEAKVPSLVRRKSRI